MMNGVEALLTVALLNSMTIFEPIFISQHNSANSLHKLHAIIRIHSQPDFYLSKQITYPSFFCILSFIIFTFIETSSSFNALFSLCIKYNAVLCSLVTINPLTQGSMWCCNATKT